jgi:2-polyprenyl-3-methyl-5-hydroxy-6-metoxy-1,4-benzoquinol methylase
MGSSIATEEACWACGGPTAGAEDPWLAGHRRCPACGLAFRSGPASELVHDLYRGASYLAAYGGGAVSDEPEPLRDQEARVRVAMVRAAVPAGRLLEIGAAGGHFLAEARKEGFDVTGIEPTDNGAESARRRFGLEILQGFVEEVDLPPSSFDAICAWHVLEHIPEPRGSLERTREWLRPGGALLIEVPNAASVRARRAGPDWMHLDLTHHVSQFTPQALGTLLERSGFAVERVQTVAYSSYRPPRSPLRLASAALELRHSGRLPLQPHPTRFELLQAVARSPS